MTIFKGKPSLAFVSIVVGIFILGSVLYAANGDFEERLKKGISEFRHENYDEALRIFKGLRESDPESSLAAYYLGLTYKRLENYVEAKEHLEASLRMTPKIKGALIELIDILYRLDEINEAKRWIKVAEDEGVRPAQAAFLKGLTQLKAEEYEDAIRSFEDAKALDVQFTQSADYQIGIAHMKLKRFGEARGAFKNIIDLDPHTDIAEYASKYIELIDRKIEGERPLKMSYKYAFEYDSNVVLKPSDTSLVTRITDNDDLRHVVDFRGDYTLKLPDSMLSLKAGYGVRVTQHHDFGNYNTLTHNLSLQPSLSFEKVQASFPVGFTHTNAGDKNYLGAVSLGNLNNILLGGPKMAQLGLLYKYKDYLRPPYGDEDRTGDELIGTAGLFRFFANNKGFLNLKYSINKDWTKGNNWEYWGNKIGTGILFPFLEKFKFHAQGDVHIQRYDNTHSLYSKKRDDETYSLGTFLSYEFVKDTEFQAQYLYINNESNLSVYDYDRHVVSVGIQCKF